jgi:hypothetical protein
MKELRQSEKVTERDKQQTSTKQEAKSLDNCSCICNVEKNMSGIHSSHKAM